VKFISGADLLAQYPKGEIPYAHYGKFFEDETFGHEKKISNKKNNDSASTLVNDSI
jgi:hypothetical protein